MVAVGGYAGALPAAGVWVCALAAAGTARKAAAASVTRKSDVAWIMLCSPARQEGSKVGQWPPFEQSDIAPRLRTSRALLPIGAQRVPGRETASETGARR